MAGPACADEVSFLTSARQRPVKVRLSAVRLSSRLSQNGRSGRSGFEGGVTP